MRTDHLTNMTTPGLHEQREACLWLIDSNYQRCSESVTEDHADDADRISDEIDTRGHVTQYDFATNPQATTHYQTMDAREADANIRCAIELGDLIREYETTCRKGRPLRVVLHVCTSTDRPDLGGVYEFTR